MKLLNILLTLTLSGSALAVLLLSLRYLFLKKMPSTVYYYAWLLVLLRFALPLPGLVPTAANVTPRAEAAAVTAPVSAAESARANGAGVQRNPVAEAAAEALPPVQRTDVLPAEENAAAEPDQTDAPNAAGSETVLSRKAPELWLGIWAAGAVFSLGTAVLAYLRFTRKLRLTLRAPDRRVRAQYAAVPGRKPALYRSAGLKTPLMYGLFSPKIVLPEREYDEELLQNILRHELLHYRRCDTLYKWSAVFILSVHWFNPLSWLIRRELNRACELSCDEMLLRSMSVQEKRSYGNTLLNMAAAGAIPAGVVATTFCTEKKNLKERLEQIMTYNKKSRARVLAAVLALVFLVGCGTAAGPAATVKNEASSLVEDGVVQVSTVDELLEAIAPDTVIELSAGTYDLSAAADYGRDSANPYYSWSSVYSEDNSTAAELELRNVENLTLRGAGKGETVIAAVPRYANVLKFVGCRGISLEDLTAGHTTEPGFCAGGVLRFETCSDVAISGCGLYGCGTIGVDALETTDLTVRDSDIYECSYGAVFASRCRNVLVDSCDVYGHGNRAGEGSAINIFNASYSEGFTVYNSKIHDNSTQWMLCADYTKNARFLSNEVKDNHVDGGMFAFTHYGATVDGCAFTENDGRGGWYGGGGTLANDIAGNQLDRDALAAMTLRDIGPDVAVEDVKIEAPTEVPIGGTLTVTTVDEFLAAIGPDRIVVLDGELFDLSTAANYGSVGGEYYFWQQSYDGPELVIHDVPGLTIQSASTVPENTTLAAIPRYANVLNFRNCENLVLAGFTAGHTKEPGSCSGGVINLQSCDNVMFEKMRLYGCGVLGIQAAWCTTVYVLRTEIYECSQGATSFFQTDGIAFSDCVIHDVPSPSVSFTECGDVTWNGDTVPGWSGMYDVTDTDELVEFRYPEEEAVYYTGGVGDLVNPFAEEPTAFYPAGSAQAEFAASARQAFADGDWEALAGMVNYPLQLFYDGASYQIHDREKFVESASDAFTDRMRERIGAGSLEEYGSSLFGTTFCDHLMAFVCIGDPNNENDYRVNAISVDQPLWPGRSMYATVTP